MIKRGTPKIARVSAVRKAADKMPDNYLKCRVRRHAWDDYTAELVGKFWHVQLICLRCRSVRKLKLTLDGHVVSSTIPTSGYADGYLLKDMGRIDVDGMAALRLELTVRSSGLSVSK